MVAKIREKKLKSVEKTDEVGKSAGRTYLTVGANIFFGQRDP